MAVVPAEGDSPKTKGWYEITAAYVSPIGADVPQIDFSVQLKNYDHYFNVDNPKSAINFLETGQEMEI